MVAAPEGGRDNGIEAFDEKHRERKGKKKGKSMGKREKYLKLFLKS